MRLCAIRLENVRRFIDPVEVTGIGPGLNVLSAPNEQGKSTIFDALHALFFKDAKSWDKEVRALAPHAGGDPKIAVEIEQDDGHYRIEKQFTKASGKGEVRIWHSGALFKQADAAEAWLRGVIKSPKDGGPAGLLWVRQGLTAFEDAKDTLAARRDLLSSVAGEVGMVTGGAQMDGIRRQVRGELDRYVTKRGAKLGGPLDQAAKAVAKLQETRSRLAAQVVELRQFLDQRLLLRREQQDLQHPEALAQRQSRLLQAEQDMRAAQQYQDQVQQADQNAQMAAAVLDRHRGKIAGIDAQLLELTQARAAQTSAQTSHDGAVVRHQQASAAARSTTDAAASARVQAQAARALCDQVLRAEAARHAGLRRKELQGRLTQADAQQRRIDGAMQAADQGPDASALAAIEICREELALASRAREASAAAITVRYQAGGQGQILLDDTAVPGGERLPLPDGGLLQLQGIGSIEIHPGLSADPQAVDAAAAALQAALDQAGCETVDIARQAAHARSAAGAGLAEARNTLNLLAPDGRDALRQKIAALPEPVSGQVDLPERDVAETAAAQARQTEETARRAQEQARATEAESGVQAGAAAADFETASTRVSRAGLGLGDPDQAAADRQLLTAETAKLTQALHAAAATCDRLRAEAPNADQADAALQRAKSVFESARVRGQDIATELAGLEARIDTHASQAVEEELAETEGRLTTAKAQWAAVQFEVDVLTRLDQALDQARRAAQEHYIGPIMREMEPLLRMVWPDARLDLDPEQVLPSQLMRSGGEEDFEVLSGGTQEQIALLVRLAFARMLAKAGQAAPVILDDAIVYTDDARIERIFNALTHQANDLQILVFSCRQKVFRDLGGQSLAIRPAGPERAV